MLPPQFLLFPNRAAPDGRRPGFSTTRITGLNDLASHRELAQRQVSSSPLFRFRPDQLGESDGVCK